MCGIAVKLITDPAATVSRGEIAAMLDPMVHRGPDGQGIHLDANVGLGHCRLSIIDLGGGAQPMTNEDGTVWVVFNGEIYNFQALRADLIARGHTFRSNCDTEVIIHLYEEYGAACVEHLRGMFAFAIWDQKHRRLFVARDRVGIKPLYYAQTATAFYIASELKAIVADPKVSREIDPVALGQFFSFFYLPGERTMFRSVRRLLPGHSMTVEAGKPTIRQYWDLKFTNQRAGRPFDEVVEELHGLLRSTVRDHMIADVPVGVLLSGGVDSSAVLSFAVESTAKKIKTFTVGFDGNQVVDERPYARMAAERFGTDHHEITITADDFWNFLPEYVWHMEDPVCEPPAVALHYVSKLASKHVKVVLSGEGGDEAFAGYPNYPNMLRLQRLEQRLGPLARPLGATGAMIGSLIGSGRMERYGNALGRPLAAHYFSRTSCPSTFFNREQRQFFDPRFLESAMPFRPALFMSDLLRPVRHEGFLNQMLYADTKTWLPDDLLVKADKITMANSLELRVPLLDHRVLEFAASLPSDYKVRGKETKRVLKAAFAKTLPVDVIQRKKAGFPVPYNDWMRGPFNERVRALLFSSQASNRGYLNPRGLDRLLRHHALTGHYAKEIFSLLVVELWQREFVDTLPASAGRTIQSAFGSVTSGESVCT